MSDGQLRGYSAVVLKVSTDVFVLSRCTRYLQPNPLGTEVNG